MSARLLATLLVLLLAGCAGKPEVKSLSPAGGRELTTGQQLLIYEKVETGWELVASDLSGPLRLEVEWADAKAEPATAILNPESPGFAFKKSGIVKLSLSAPSKVRFEALSLRGVKPAVRPAPVSEERPNVLLYLVDTLRRDAVGTYGGPKGLTPNLDSLAAESAVYDQVVASSGWTKPSLGSIFTGMYPRAHGANTPTAQLRPEYPTLAELLAERGYATAGFSPNPSADKRFGYARGFQEWSNRYLESSEQVHARALSWLDQKPERPFFLFVHSMDPHDPYCPPPGPAATFAAGVETSDYFKVRPTPDDPACAMTILEDKAQLFLRSPQLATAADAEALRKLYLAEVAYNDATLGALLKGLRERNLFESTLIIVASDHGEEFREHGGWLHGGQMFQELISLPLIVRYPGQAQSYRVAEPVGHIDLFSTVLNFSGGAPANDGRDLRTSGPRQALQALAVPPGALTETLVEDGWKLVRTKFEDGRVSVDLFNLLEDPAETSNAASADPIRTGYFLARLDELEPVASEVPAQINTELDRSLRTLHYLH